MRNLKKFLALVLAMLMVVSAAATVSAFEDVAEDNLFADAIADLSVLDIVNGYDGETFGPEDAVTRQQFALMMARAITGITDDAEWAQGGLVAFDDVTEYQYAIATVVKAGIVDGFLDNTFRPEEGVTFIQALKMAVCALGYDDGTLDWWQGYYNVALDLGLTANLNQIPTADYALNRGEVAQLIYNMLYATAANGSSLAYDIFGIGVEEPVAELTTFVLTATDEQTAYEGMDVAEGGYVGVQLLVDGVAEGDVIYLPVEMFGFEGDEDEAAFLSAFGFANWNEEEGTFDAIVPVGTSWKIGHDEISAIKNGKFTYDSKNFYPVEALTGTEIRNEVVLYNSTDYGYSDGNKQLFLNAKGEVLGAEGQVVLEAVYSVAGNIVSYLEVSTGKYLSISNATAKYGEVIDDIAQSYTIVDTAVLTGAYELTVYDDDMDGKMDRAYWTPVYISVKEGFENTDQHKTDGPFRGWDEGNNGVITGMEDLAAGDVFVYTFNKQLGEVTVLDVVEIEEGAVKKIDTTTNKSSTWYSTITLTDGTALKLYNYTDGGYSKAEVALGAEVQVSSAIDYTDVDGWLHQIASDLEFDLIDDDKLLSVLETGDLIRYYARNGVIIFAETYDIDDMYDRVVLKDVIDADLEAIYVDVYRDGAVEEIAVTSIWDGDEYVTLADLSWIKISKILNDLVDDIDAGNIYKIAELNGGYKMSVAMDDTQTSNFAKDYDDPSAFGLYAVGTDTAKANGGKIVFEDGVADAYTSGDRTNRLRTNSDTVWYFINGGKVRVATGDIDDAAIVLAKDTAGKVTTRIYADKLGYKNLVSTDGKTTLSNKGTATEVYVINAGEGTYGFGWGSEDTSIVMMNGMTSTKKTDYYTQGSAEEVGLNPKDYTAANYYKYASTYSIDMYTGSSYTVYSTFLLDNNTPYTVDENGVVVSATAPTAVKYTNLKLAGIEYEDEYISIVDADGTTILNTEAAVDTIKARSLTSTTTRTGYSAIKSNIMTSTDTEYEIAYINGYGLATTAEDEDGTFVFVVGAFSKVEADATKVTSDAVWTVYGSSTQHHAVGTVTPAADGSITVEAKTYNVSTGAQLMSDSALWKQSAANGATYSASISKFTTGSNPGWDDTFLVDTEIDITATYKDGVFKVTKVTYADTNIVVKLEEGNYKMNIMVSNTTAGAPYGQLQIAGLTFEVPAAN